MDDFQRKQMRKLRSEGLGYQSIGKIVGLSRDSVRNYCKRNPELLGYRNAVTKMMKDQASGLPCCLHCKETFIPKGTGRPKKFCSDACRRYWWQNHPELHQKQNTAYYELTCQHCGKSFLSYGNANRKFCSHSCYIQSRFY